MKHLILYKDEFNDYTWQEYCEILEVTKFSLDFKGGALI